MTSDPPNNQQLTDAAGNVSPNGQTCIGLPYGNGEYCTPTQSTNYLFAGKERDPETNGPNGNDYFGARYYASTMGQFLTPDWSVKAEPVPYAKIDNPQSLNLYRYVFDNPLTGVDLDGHQDQFPSSETESLVGDFCATQIASNNLANCLRNALMTPGAGGESFAAFQAKLNQKQQAGTHSQDLCKGNPNCVVETAGPNCTNDPACQLGYSQFFGSIHRIPQPQAPNNRSQTPWYKTCGAQAAGSFLIHGGLDALAAIPGLGTGAAAAQVSISVFNTDWSASGTAGQLGRGLATAGGVNGFVGAIPYVAESGSKVAEAIPGVGIFVGVASVGLDAYNAVQEYRSGCVGH